MRTKRSLRIAEWPRLDQQLWDAALTSGPLFDDGGAAAHWAPATRSQVESGYAQWLSSLSVRDDLDPSTWPTDRITTARLQTYVTELQDRGLSPVSVASRMRDLAEALRVMIPRGDRTLVVRVLRRLEQTARPTRDKRLVAAGDAYDAGITRMQRSEVEPGRSHILRALHYSDGLRISMLAAKAVRLRNLAGTRLGSNLVRVGTGYRWRFSATETKTGEVIDAELPVRLTSYIDRWIDHHRRAMLGDRQTDALWISVKGTPMGRAAVYDRVCITTKQELGIRINPHAFRYIVATTVAIALPEDVRMTPFLLDHRDDRTVNAHYNRADSLSASRRYLQRLEMRRQQAFAGQTGKG